MQLFPGADDNSWLFGQGSAAVSNLVDQHFPGLAPTAGGGGGGGGVGLSSGRWASAAGGGGGGQPPGSVFDFPSLSESYITRSLRYSLLSQETRILQCVPLFCGCSCVCVNAYGHPSNMHPPLFACSTHTLLRESRVRRGAEPPCLTTFLCARHKRQDFLSRTDSFLFVFPLRQAQYRVLGLRCGTSVLVTWTTRASLTSDPPWLGLCSSLLPLGGGRTRGASS
jgi:hypothetical protein